MNDSPIAIAKTRRLVWLASLVFAAVVFWDSAGRWATFRYGTFDLAFYVQALWKLVHGNAGTVSLLNVPLLGEHANVIVLVLVPFFACFPHPLLPVAFQTIAIASMGPTAFRIGRRLGLDAQCAGLMALAALLTPATGFVALHEFHPEAFTAPFLLLAIDAFLAESLLGYWFWFLATLACKENMTLLLATWCFVNFFRERRKGAGWQVAWCVVPGLIALGWAVVYAGILAPKLNAGNVEYTALYSHLAVPWMSFPGTVAAHLWRSFQGDLVYGLILPFCAVSLLRPRWLFIALPVLAQHLLSVRSSEWNIEFHYAAPLIPLFWIAACEATASLWSPRPVAVAIVASCLATQVWMGPLRMLYLAPRDDNGAPVKQAIVESIGPDASVVAGLPYLSHLAKRNELYSLHHVLKGLKTLSRIEWNPPKTSDVVFVDYDDRATFDPVAGYYHPQMRVVTNKVIPSSDVLLHQFLKESTWKVESHGSITLFRKTNGQGSSNQEELDASVNGAGVREMGPGNALVSARFITGRNNVIGVRSVWALHGERTVIPWMSLSLTATDGAANGKSVVWLTRGLCVPQGWDNGHAWEDLWSASLSGQMPAGKYQVRALFYDNSKFAWSRMSDPNAPLVALGSVDLGVIEIR